MGLGHAVNAYAACSCRKKNGIRNQNCVYDTWQLNNANVKMEGAVCVCVRV